MWDLPELGIKPLFPALASRFLTTEPPGKPSGEYPLSDTCCKAEAGVLGSVTQTGTSEGEASCLSRGARPGSTGSWACSDDTQASGLWRSLGSGRGQLSLPPRTRGRVPGSRWVAARLTLGDAGAKRALWGRAWFTVSHSLMVSGCWYFCGKARLSSTPGTCLCSQ